MKPNVLTTCPICAYEWDARTWTRCPRCVSTMRAYEPSPAEIRLACFAIQRTWTRAEERKRRVVKRVDLDVVRVSRGGDHMRRRDADGSDQ